MSETLSANGERIEARVSRHWFAFVRDGGRVALVGVIPLLILLWLMQGPLGDFVPLNHGVMLALLGLWALLVWIALAMIWTLHFLDMLIISDRRIIRVEQLAPFSRSVSEFPLERIEAAEAQKSGFLQTFFNFGSIVMYVAGPTESTLSMDDVPHPESVRELIFRNIGGVAKLAEANAAQQKLLHTISHEVKAHLSKNEAALASIVEGDFGDAPQPLKSMAGAALADTRKGVDMVIDLLSASNFKTGSVSYAKKPFDLKAAVLDIAAELRPDAERKKLALECVVKDGEYLLNGDEEKIRRHVIRNLIDNAIRYTPSGSVRVLLARAEANFVLLVADSGVGIAQEDFSRLFTEGGKGVRSTEVNPASTGFGLFVAKSVVEAHGGRIWAESEGAGKGSRFYASFPAA